ncbi:MAG TPA: hypothetical protein VEB66_12260 [Opitutaceae bacterium]|nr:hypothetical protein [Opitutaceae bacterium]
MPEYLYRARGPRGERITDSIQADSLAAARRRLEERHCTAIEFYTGDNAADVARMSSAGTGIDAAAAGEWTAADEIEAQRRRGTGAQIWWAFTKHLIIFSLLARWNYASMRDGPPYGWLDWLGFVATPLYAAVFLMMVLPLTIFTQILEASVWHDWARQARWIGAARLLRRLMRTGIPENELVFREAYALAAQGNLSAALRHAEPLRQDPNTVEYLFLGRLATIHEYAGDFAGGLRCLERAIALKPEVPDLWIDLATFRLRHFGNAAGGREALARTAGHELPELARAMVEIAEGMAATIERDFASADRSLRASAARFDKFGIPLIKTIRAELDAWHAVALAGLGRAAEGRKLLARARPLLTAQKSHALLARAEAALA